MNINQFQFSGRETNIAVPRTFISNVFALMGHGLAISAFTAWLFGTDLTYMAYLVSETGPTGLGYAVIFAPIAFVLLMSFAFQRLSFPSLLGLFLVYSLIMGMSLSFIFLTYTQASIFQTFGIAGLTFGVMAVVGYTTKTDLTKFGSILIMALIGIIIASLVNLFLRSSGLEYIVSFLGVLIFTGLTAYDVQKLKNMGATVGNSQEGASKLAVMGALTLYLDFINLFLFLLRFFGAKKD